MIVVGVSSFVILESVSIFMYIYILHALQIYADNTEPLVSLICMPLWLISVRAENSLLKATFRAFFYNLCVPLLVRYYRVTLMSAISILVGT